MGHQVKKAFSNSAQTDGMEDKEWDNVFIYPIEPGLHLKLLSKKDKDTIFQLVDQARDKLRIWLPWVDGVNSPDLYDKLFAEWNMSFAKNESLQAAIVAGESIVGMIGFHPIDWVNRKVELGYWLSPKHEGNGYVTKACRAMIHIAFEEYGLHRVEIHCALGNHQSRAVATRLGMREEGVMKEAIWLDGQPHDKVVYAMTRTDWK